ncbi:MAG TPA: Hsp20/alpha crystallin family protein [Dysgonamonadaceae bacterium]|nr:Hsp20/alpha crystallin family protein [Dysgonamonadaceae bacterium]
MSLIRFSNRMPRLFDHFFDNDLIDWSNRNFSETNTTLPAVNVKEKKDGFEIEMSAPGLKKEDFNVDLSNSVLTISCAKKEEDETKDEDGRYTRQEFSYQSFSRSFNLPETVDHEKIDAKYEDGILKLNIPKKEEVIPSSKRIEIS